MSSDRNSVAGNPATGSKRGEITRHSTEQKCSVGPCRFCGGSGTTANGEDTCDHCGGSGVLREGIA
jgi:hypothetical protein